MLRCSKRVRTVYHFVNRVTFQIEDHLCRYRNHNRIRSWNRLSFIMGIPVPMGRIIYIEKSFVSLPWRRNGRDSVSNHQPHDCLLNRLFRRRSKKTSKLRVTGLCAGNSPGTGEFPAQMASYAENVSIWWRHHGDAVLHLKDTLATDLEVAFKASDDHRERFSTFEWEISRPLLRAPFATA